MDIHADGVLLVEATRFRCLSR